jgi:DNA topoisomerase-1
MAKNLVIVESPAKAKTIGKILGAGFEVKSSVGHVRDLPQKTLGVDIEKDFAPKYVQVPGKNKVIDELRHAARACDALYLAPDPDREGEAIAWHLSELLASAAKGKPIHRVQYNEITPRAVREAIEHPGRIDMHRVDAQQARRVLDRIVGYTVSPMLWRRIKRGLSAGRVQSVALRLVCERERQIRAFRPEAYWVLGARVSKQSPPLDPFAIRLVRVDGEKADVRAEEQARAALEDLRDRALRVADLRSRTITRRPLPPFITSTLQQAASSVCGFAPGRTMSLAQKLYEGADLGPGGPAGLITYMRTDSVAVSREAQDAARAFVLDRYGAEFCPETPNVYRSRSGAQEAHEAIRPTDVQRTPESLSGVLDAPLLKLYDLIWRRFVASQMVPARIEQRTAVVASEPPPAQRHAYEFSASASEVLFAGFLQVMALDLKAGRENEGENGEDADEVERLPPLARGETLRLIEWTSVRKETKPPPRYSEAALVRALEANGVGRPSTYAAILETLVQREYATREKRTLAPTDLGEQVCDLLVAKLNDLFDVGFTASMEEQLDQVEEGGVQWTEMLRAFYDRFKQWMEAAREPAADPAKLEAILAELTRVHEWAPAITRGRRTYCDADFVASVRKQIEDGERPVSERQLDSLMKMALRYRAQIPGIEERARDLGFAALIGSDEASPPPPATLRKFEVLQPVGLDPEQRRFVDSLAEQARGGRRLSEAQNRALDRILISSARQIPGFDALRVELGVELPGGPGAEPDTESAGLIEVLGRVKEWREPTKRGRMVFDDRRFFESVSQQFRRRGGLSPRQRAALQKMIFRYRDQFPDFEEIAARMRASRESPAAAAEPAGSGAP